jgi:hypothetical protein
MKLAFKDFKPEIKEKGFFSNTYEPFKNSLQRANDWISAESGAAFAAEGQGLRIRCPLRKSKSMNDVLPNHAAVFNFRSNKFFAH